MPWLLATGDDDGVIKLWDPPKPEPVRTFTHHFDFISDFLWIEEKKQLVSTSGDGTLSVIDVRSKKAEPLAQSEDQEDELLSIVAIKGFVYALPVTAGAGLLRKFGIRIFRGSKTVIGTQLGILSVFNRSAGWGDCVDRIPGHPQSIDALCALPSRYSASGSAILTGSSDGLLRAVEILPTKMIGIVADHGSFPIERIAVDLGGEGRWVGSAGHEEVLKLTDLADIFEEDKGGEEDGEGGGGDDDESAAAELRTESDQEADSDSDDEESDEKKRGHEKSEEEEDSDGDSGSEAEVQKEKKRKRKNPNDMMKRRKKGRNEVEAEPAFFADL